MAILLATAVALPAEGWALDRKAANSIFPEGEYLVKNGRRVASKTPKKKSKTYRAVEAKPKAVKKSTKKVAKAPAAKRGLASKSVRKGKPAKTEKSLRTAKDRKSKRAQPKRFAKPNRKSDRRSASVRRDSERDSPFISSPRKKVVREDKMIVMEDPAVKAPLPKPKRVGAMITPDQEVLDPDAESAPAEVIDAKAAAVPPVVGPAPASVAPAEAAPVSETVPVVQEHRDAVESANREPDAFDLHSGADPMHGP